MDLQALARQTYTTTASTDPHFNNNTFEEKFNNGWLKKYYYGVLIFLVLTLANFINTFRLSIYYLGNPKQKPTTDSSENIEYYSTLLYSLSLLILAALLVLFILGLFLQYQAIRLRSLERQYACIKVFTIFVMAQAGGAVLNILFALITTPISIISGILMGVVFLVVGVLFRFLASNVKNIMLGKQEESFRFDKSAFEA